MEPRDKLEEAARAAREGRYADALAAHVWFHEHALEHQSSLAGVRLSFALGDWVELGRAYPEALRRLEAIRDANAAALLAGPRRRRQFHDVRSIDRALGATGRTYTLFCQLVELDPDFARACVDLAIDALVEAGDFALAARLLDDPAARVQCSIEGLNADVARLCDPAAATRYLERKLSSHAQAHAHQVGPVLAVLEGVGRRDEAAALRDLAVDGVEHARVRGMVRGLLTPKPVGDT